MGLKKTHRWIALVVLAGIGAFAWAGEVPAEVVIQEEGCTTFEDWRDLSEADTWHQHSSSPDPIYQWPGDWEWVRDLQADGRRHGIVPGRTLADNWAHHIPCSLD